LPDTILAFLASYEQFDCLRQHRDLYRSCVPVTGDMVVLSELQSSGCPHVDIWKYLDARKLQKNCDFAKLLCDEIGKVLEGRFTYLQCDIVNECKYDLFRSFCCIINTAYATEQILKEYQPEKIVTFNADSEPVNWTPFLPPLDIFNAVVLWCAVDAGVSTISLELGSFSEIDSLAAPLINPDVRERLTPQCCDAAERIKVLSMCEGLGRNEQDLLLNRMGREKHTDWVIASSGGNKWELPYVSLALLRHLPFDTSNFSEKVSTIKADILASISSRSEALGACIFKNDYLDFLWVAFSRWLEGAAAAYALSKFLARALRPQLFLTDLYFMGSKKCVVRGFLDENVDVISVSHSGLDYEHRNRCNFLFNQGHVAVWGPYEALKIREGCDGASRISEIGCLRADLSSLRSNVTPLHETNKDNHKKENARKRIIFFTELTPHILITEDCFPDICRDSWRSIIEMCKQHPEWDFIIKPHPRRDYFKLYNSERFKDVKNLCIVMGSAGNALSGADIAVLVNCPSSVALFAMTADIPVVYLKEAIFPWLRAVVENGGAIPVENTTQLEGKIKRLLSDEDYRGHVLKSQREFLNRAVCATGEDAVDRMLEFIDEIVGQKPPTQDREYTVWRWMLDMIMAIGYIMDEKITLKAFSQRLDELKTKGKDFVFGELDIIKMDRMGAYFLDLPLWYEWIPSGKYTKSRVLWIIYKSIPLEIRPGLREFRHYLKAAL